MPAKRTTLVFRRISRAIPARKNPDSEERLLLKVEGPDWNAVVMLNAVHGLALQLPAVWIQATGGGLFGGLGTLPILLLFFVAMYFLMIAPNQRKQKQWQAMLSALKSGDRVTTTGGIRGVVLQVKDDSVLVRVAPDNLKLEFIKSAISAVTTDEEKK